MKKWYVKTLHIEVNRLEEAVKQANAILRQPENIIQFIPIMDYWTVIYKSQNP